MLRRSFVFVVLFVVVFASNVFAQAVITENGFKDLQWGDTLKEPSADFVVLDFDKDKKLYIYLRKSESYFCYDTAFYPINYQFWEDKFVAVRLYFNAQKDPDTFQRLYNSLVAQFGVSKSVAGAKNSSLEHMVWQKGDTFLRLSYDVSAKSGYLYVYSDRLQKDYARFLQTLPDSGITYQNQPDGFLGMQWGADIKELKKMGKEFTEYKKAGVAGGYVLKGDEKTFMGVPIVRKTYGFWQDKLCSAYIYYKSDDKKESFEKIYQNLQVTYGEPSNGRYDLAGKVQYYIWAGAKTHIIVYYFVDEKESFVFFTSKELYQKQMRGE